MEMEYLCEFVVVSERKSYSKTAEEMNISQSSLSKHILMLEKQLGVKLFDRTSRKVELSEAGQRFLPYAKQAQELLHNMLQLAQDERRLNRPALSIASIPVMAQYDITAAIAGFQKMYPDVLLEVQECESKDIFGRLTSGACELAFTRGPGDETLEYLEYRRDRLVAVLPRSHPLAGEESLCLHSLKDEDFLFLDKSTSLYSLCLGLCEGAGFAPRVKYTGHRPENIIELVASGMGISLLMGRHARYSQNAAVAAVPISPKVESAICLAKKKDQKLSRYARQFWDLVASAPRQQDGAY